jgi:hypothetical protein
VAEYRLLWASTQVNQGSERGRLAGNHRGRSLPMLDLDQWIASSSGVSSAIDQTEAARLAGSIG